MSANSQKRTLIGRAVEAYDESLSRWMEAVTIQRLGRDNPLYPKVGILVRSSKQGWE